MAFAEGGGAALFASAQPGALRAVVPPQQLPAAVSVQSARDATVLLTGPTVGGVLFQVGRALPFVVDAVSYAASTISLLGMRTPFQQDRPTDAAPLRVRLAEGFHFVWHQPFVRACALLYGLANLIVPGLMLAVVVIGERQGLSSGAVGALVAAFGACVLLGSVASPLVRRRLPVRAVMLLELWAWVGCAAFVVWPSVYVLTASILPAAVAIPSTDSVAHGYRIAITPDHLLGRAESVRRTISLVLAALGPLAAGSLLGRVSERWTIAAFAACGLLRRRRCRRT